MSKNFVFNKNLLQIPLTLSKVPEPRISEGIYYSNENTLNALEKFLWSKNNSAKSFFLRGKKGSGKTFWLRSWANEMGESSVYLDLGKSTLINLKNNYKIFFLDNVDMCSSFDRSKIFEILNLTHITGNRIVMSSLISVNNLINLSFKTDLISRLKQGLIYELNELGDDLKKDLLRRHLQKLGWINNEYDKSYDYLLSYMLHHLPRELGKLKVILDNLNYVSISNKQAVSINLVKQMISK